MSWEAKDWKLSGPSLTLPALQHRSLSGCRIGFRRAGWSGGTEIEDKVQTDVNLSGIGFHVMKLVAPNASILGLSYTAYDVDSGQLSLPSAMDFWLGNENLSEECIQAVEQVLGTLQRSGTSQTLIHYQDDFLGIAFDYPAAWGSLTSTLRACYNSGYAYNYAFKHGTVLAGGRSANCSEPRERMPTDFAGFNDWAIVSNYWWSVISVDEEPQPRVRSRLIFRQAESFCGADGPLTPAYGILAIDLPEHSVIKGFVFIAPALTGALEQELTSLIGCKADEKQRYDARLAEVVGAVRSQTLAAPNADLITGLKQFAGSIRFIPTKPSERPTPVLTPTPAGSPTTAAISHRDRRRRC
jgi:hypothetical protein